ncbi:MAG: cell division protein FtsA [Bacilli bacterium]
MSSQEQYVSLDIGSSQTKVIVAQMVNDQLSIIGVGVAKTKGIKKGSIVDIDGTVQSIREAVEAAERMAGCKIEQVILSIPANNAALHPCNGVVAISGTSADGVPEIGSEDIVRVIDHACVIALPKERQIIDVLPRQFIIDGIDGILDPRGLSGLRLELEGTLVSTSRIYMSNVIRTVNKAGLEVTDTVFGPHAVAALTLTQEDKEQGVALVDIGGTSSTVTVYQDGRLLGTSYLPFGGEMLTRDISAVYNVSLYDAEQLKLTYGHAFLEEALRELVFEVPNSKRDVRSTQFELAEIIEARFDEMVTAIISEMVALGAQELPCGVVFTGGTMSLPGAGECANRRFNVGVRIAYPDYIGVREAKFTSAVGTIYACYQSNKLRSKRRASGTSERSNVVPIVHRESELEVPIAMKQRPKLDQEEAKRANVKQEKQNKKQSSKKFISYIKSLWE